MALLFKSPLEASRRRGQGEIGEAALPLWMAGEHGVLGQNADQSIKHWNDIRAAASRRCRFAFRGFRDTLRCISLKS
jgi:hypothetical protein